MEDNGEKCIAKIVDKRIVNNTVEYLCKTERSIWLPKFICKAQMIEEFEKNLAAEDMEPEELPSSNEQNPPAETLQESEDEENSNKENINIELNYDEALKELKSPASTASLIKKRGEGLLTYYLIKIVTYNWAPENTLDKEQIERYYKALNSKGSSTSLSSTTLSTLKPDVNLVATASREGQSEIDQQSTISMKEERTVTIVDRRKVDHKDQFLVKYERSIWLDRFLCDPQKIQEFEESPTAKMIQTQQEVTAPFSTSRLAAHEKDSLIAIAGSKKDEFISWDSALHLVLEKLNPEENEIEYEASLNAFVITEKRVFNGSIQYLLQIQTYTWLAERLLDSQMVFDYMMSDFHDSEPTASGEGTSREDFAPRESLVEIYKAEGDESSESSNEPEATAE